MRIGSLPCCCVLACLLLFLELFSLLLMNCFRGDDQCLGTLLTFLSGASTDAQSGLSVSLSV